MKIGVVLSSMGLAFRQGLPAAARMSVSGLQIDAAGDLAPDQLTDTGRREVRNLLKTYNQSLLALNCPFRRGIDDPDNLQARIDMARRIMTLAFELGCRNVVLQCPALPKEDEVARAQLMRESLEALGRHGDRTGTVLALEIGLDAPDAVATYLDRFDLGALKVTFDPSNLLMNGFDPAAAILPLHRRIAHVHARDARRSTVNRSAQEVSLGSGDIDWLRVMANLAAIEYRDGVMVKRDSGEDRRGDVERGVAFLRRVMVPT